MWRQRSDGRQKNKGEGVGGRLDNMMQYVRGERVQGWEGRWSDSEQEEEEEEI